MDPAPSLSRLFFRIPSFRSFDVLRADRTEIKASSSSIALSVFKVSVIERRERGTLNFWEENRRSVFGAVFGALRQFCEWFVNGL